MRRDEHERAMRDAEWMDSRGFRDAAVSLRRRSLQAWERTARAAEDWYLSEIDWGDWSTLRRAFYLPDDWKRALSDARWLDSRGFHEAAARHWKRGAREVCETLDAQWTAAAMRTGLCAYGEAVEWESRATGVGRVEGRAIVQVADFARASAFGPEVSVPWESYGQASQHRADELMESRGKSAEGLLDGQARAILRAIDRIAERSPWRRPVFRDRYDTSRSYDFRALRPLPLDCA